MINSNHRKIILFGLGLFGEKILKALSDKWYLVGIDIDKNKIEKLKDEFKDKKNIKLINGDASSILTWRKLDLNDVSAVISAIQDVDVALEICRIGRESFNLPKEVQFIVLLMENEREDDFKKFNTELINPVDITTKTVISLVEKNFKIPQNIGIGKGELVETTILANSHLVDRELKHFKSNRWKISAIYRNNKFILPTKDTVLKVGDRVVISGYPSVVESIVNIFLKGVPQFPLQYGRDIAVPFSPFKLNVLEEAEFLRKHSKAHRLQIYPWKKRFKAKIKEVVQNILKNSFYTINEKPVKNFLDLINGDGNIGIGVISEGLTNIDDFWFRFSKLFKISRIYYNLRFKKVFKNAKKPFLISRGSFPYSKILVSLNSSNPVMALDTGLELSRISKIPLEVLYIKKPEKLMGEIDREHLNQLKEVVSDFEHIYRTKLDFNIKEGNPVKRTLKYIEENKLKKVLLIMTYNNQESFSVFNPNVQYEIAIKTDISLLLIPSQKDDLTEKE